MSSFKCRILENGRKLQVVDAQLLDMGTYKCVASNTAGNATKEFSLNILGKSFDVFNSKFPVMRTSAVTGARK